MKPLKKIGVFLLSILLSFTFSGCWNYREIETLSIVSGIAVDKGESGYKYHVTFQYIKISENAQQGTSPELVEADGNTLFDTVRNALTQIEKKFFFSDCKIVIISKELAEEGISPFLDWLCRDAETRITTDLVISNEETARDLLKQQPDDQQISAYTINNIIENNTKFLAKGSDTAIYMANSLINSKGISLIIPLMGMHQYEDKAIPELIGSAIFKEDKLIGLLDSMESQYLLYIKNEIKETLLITSLNSQKNNVTLEVRKSSTKCIPSFTNGVPSVQLQISIRANYAEENSEKTILDDYGIEAIQESAENTLKSGILDLIKKTQNEYGSDIFGFGDCFYKNYPQYWEENKYNWDEIFPTLSVTVEANVEIKSTAVAGIRKKGE